MPAGVGEGGGGKWLFPVPRDRATGWVGVWCVHTRHQSPPPPFSRETEELKDAGLKPSSSVQITLVCQVSNG